MEHDALRLLIQHKLADGRLPLHRIPRIWGGAGSGERCAACDEVITTGQLSMEGVGDGHRAIQLHVSCFYLWDEQRQAPGRPAA